MEGEKAESKKQRRISVRERNIRTMCERDAKEGEAEHGTK